MENLIIELKNPIFLLSVDFSDCVDSLIRAHDSLPYITLALVFQPNEITQKFHFFAQFFSFRFFQYT